MGGTGVDSEDHQAGGPETDPHRVYFVQRGSSKIRKTVAFLGEGRSVRSPFHDNQNKMKALNAKRMPGGFRLAGIEAFN